MLSTASDINVDQPASHDKFVAQLVAAMNFDAGDAALLAVLLTQAPGMGDKLAQSEE